MPVPVGLNVWSRLVEELFPYLDQTVAPFESLWFPDHVQYGGEQGRRGLDAPRLRPRALSRQALHPRSALQ